MFPIVPLAATILGLGVLIIGSLTFWASLQNWLSDLIQRTRSSLGASTESLQSALVVVDRVMVNGQRVIVATARAIFGQAEAAPTVVEEARLIPLDALPADVRARMEADQPVTYELSVGTMQQINPVPARQDVTYKLVVRRID